MKSLLILGLVIVLLTPSLALAGGHHRHRGWSSTDWALALGSFAVANQILTGQTVFHKLFGQESAAPQPYPAAAPQQSAAPQPYPVAVPQPYPVAVPQPYPVAVPQPYPVGQPAMCNPSVCPQMLPQVLQGSGGFATAAQ